MADSRPKRATDLNAYRPKRCPDVKDAAPLEKMWWDHAEELRMYLEEARMDRGHTAVTAMKKEIAVAMERYHLSRASRLAEDAARATKGSVLDQIVAAVATCPASMQDAVIARLVEMARARG